MRRSTTPRDAQLAEFARRSHGVVSAGQLYELGFDEAAIRRRVANGRLHRLYRGVYAVGHTITTREGRALAAVLACGPGAVLSHRSAAELWGIRPTAAARFDVTVPRTSGVRTSARIVVHRPTRPVEKTSRHGIPVTTPGQTLADLALALPRRPLEKAIEMAEVRKLHAAVPHGHPGAQRLLEAASRTLPVTTESPLEDAFLALCDTHGIPRPLVQTVVEGYRVDFCWPGERLIVETDGYEHHGTQAAFERDRAKDARLTALGWRVLRFTRLQVDEDPGFVGAVLLSVRSRSLATP
jgi:hypothetical protein